jgi:SEC-C motif-containing protein
MSLLCKCGSGIEYQNCCGQYIDGNLLPETPEQLMRSRYTSYVLDKIEYIVKTMQGKALKKFKPSKSDLNEHKIEWQKLEVIKHIMQNNKGFVEFKAYYLDGGQLNCMHELSEFKRKNGQWYYIDGEILN